MTLADVLDIANNLGVLGASALAVWAFGTRKVVPERTYDETRATLTKALETALATNTELADQVRVLAAQFTAETESRRTLLDGQRQILDFVISRRESVR